MSIGIYTTFPHSKNNELQKRQAPSLVGEGWGEESKIKYLNPLIPAFSLKGEGAPTCVDTIADEDNFHQFFPACRI